ncbi:MAG: hypothetical protein PUE01_07785 [Clostridiaceae bacterium]|nr:hypothetical protein [Clostridiaceae bacterium]
MFDIDNRILNKLTKEQREDLQLLAVQRFALSLFICSDLTSYKATLSGIQGIINKYLDEPIEVGNPDEYALSAAIFSLMGRVIFQNIAFTKYGYLVERRGKGLVNYDYSLEPNEIIALANVNGVVTNILSLVGALGIYSRDLNQPVFGIR